MLHNFFVSCIDAFSVISNQGRINNVVNVSIGFLVSFWSVAVLILSGIYSGQLVSSLLYQNLKLYPFDNFESFVDCVENDSCKFIADNDSLSYSYLQKIFFSENNAYRRLMKALDSNKMIVTETVDEALKKISKEKDLYLVSVMAEIDYLLATDFNKDCIYKWVQFDYFMHTFPMSKNFKFKKEINEFALFASQFGLFHKTYSKYLNTERDCKTYVLGESLRPINLVNFLGCLFILIIGIVVASVFLLFENAKYRLVIK